jgi:CHASE2 domain-containing sensor protein/serine phosphatase RsbU (regulator of sigma subunit)
VSDADAARRAPAGGGNGRSRAGRRFLEGPKARPGKSAMRRIWGIGLLVLLALAVLLWWRTPWGDRLQAYSFDSLQILSPRKIESLPVTIVAIDDKSIAALGQWPWPRTELAELVRAVAREQPAAIGIDVLMPEPDRLSPQRMLERVGALDPAIERTVRALPSNDAMLAQAISEAPVVLVAAGVPEATGRALHAPPFIVTGSGSPPLPHLGGVVPNIEMLDAKAAGHGLISVEPSNTMFRRFALVADVNGTLAPALSIEMLRVALDVPALRLHVRSDAVRGISVGKVFVPTEADGAVRVYYSRGDARRYVSAIDVLQGKAPPDALHRKLVLIGLTGLGLRDDFHLTALGEPMPGSEIHAQLLENLYDQTLLVRPPWAPQFELAVFVALGLLLIWFTPRLKPLVAAALALGCVALALAAAFAAFRTERLLFDATPGLSLMLFFGVLLLLTLAESRQRRKAMQRVLQEQRERSAYVTGELEAAQRIQTGLLPGVAALCADGRVDLAATMTPAREVGGDLYDFFMLDERRLFFLIGDVAGKGLAASMFMAVSKALVKNAALRAPGAASIGALMTAANMEIGRDNAAMFFVTAFAAILDLDSGELDYCNAGHDNPLRLAPGATDLQTLADGDGPPLCVVDGFEYHGARVRLQPGELLCLATDGVFEAQDANEALYGHARLAAVLLRGDLRDAASADVVAAVQADVAAFGGDVEPADDLTLVCLRWKGPGGSAAA